jgi:cytochrome c2
MGSSNHAKFGRHALRYAVTALGICALQSAAYAQQGDLAEGEQLYAAQCKLCHGSPSADKTADTAAPRQQLVRLALQSSVGHTRVDVAPAVAAPEPGTTSAGNHEQLAFAPPFGPPLRGVYGRPAGSVEGFQYSTTFLSTLKGMEWNDAALDVWITNTQAWVPGVYMFYKQPDPEIRRKIILYLKANP